MKRKSALTLSGILLTGALGFGQAPIVPVGTAETPVGTTVTVRAQAPMPMPAALPAVTPAPAPAPAPAAPEAPAEEPKKEEDKFFAQKLLESSPAGQTLAGNGWKISGWTQGSFTTANVNGSTLPVPFIDRVNRFSLNQNWLHVEKSIDTEKKEFQIGGAVDLILPGTDYRFTPSRGLLTQGLTRGDTYGVDLFQAYVDLFLPNLGGSTLRVGKFATPIGYETVQGTTTPFLSRSYNFQYNPFTHTGVTIATPLGDDWSMLNGFVLGNDNFIGDTGRLTYLGQLKWAPKEGKTSVAFTTSITRPEFDSNKNFNYYNTYNLVLSHKLTDKLTYAADATYSHMDNAPAIGFANWYGLGNYLLYDVTDNLQSKARVEVFNDAQGYRTGTSGVYTGLTYGLTWKPTPWLYVMPEVRYDHNNNNSPFDGKSDMFTATFGAIVRW